LIDHFPKNVEEDEATETIVARKAVGRFARNNRACEAASEILAVPASEDNEILDNLDSGVV